MLPEVVRPGQDPAVLHPDDLLVDEGAGLFPAGLQHRLAARGVPAVPGGVLGDRLGDGGGDEAVVELGALRAVVPGRAVGLATSPCSASDGSSRRSRRGTAGRSRTGSPARRSSAGARRLRWCCRRRAAGGRRGSRGRRCVRPDCAAARGWSPAARSPRRHLLHRRPPARRPAACRTRRRRSRPATGRNRRPAARSVPPTAAPRPRCRVPSACCRRCGRPAAAPRSDGRARSPAPRSARAASRPARGRGPRSVRRPRPRGRARSSRTRPCWRRSSRPGPPVRLRVLRVGLEARERPRLDRAPGRSSASWWARFLGRVDAGGFRTPDAVLDSTRGPAATSGVRSKGRVHWCLRGARVGPASGWLPKNPALSLAMSRASPASIQCRQEGPGNCRGAGPASGPSLDTGVRRPPSTQRGERAFQRTLPILPSE